MVVAVLTPTLILIPTQAESITLILVLIQADRGALVLIQADNITLGRTLTLLIATRSGGASLSSYSPRPCPPCDLEDVL